MELTQRLLRSYLTYNKATGVFVWRTTHKQAGTTTSNGYIRIGIEGKQYKAHRLAFLYVTGKWPEHEVDHINGVKSDNRWANLRDVSVSTNQHNRTEPNTGRELPLGVTKHKCGRFQAQIFVGGKCNYLGLFGTPEEASAAYVKAKGELA